MNVSCLCRAVTPRLTGSPSLEAWTNLRFSHEVQSNSEEGSALPMGAPQSPKSPAIFSASPNSAASELSRRSLNGCHIRRLTLSRGCSRSMKARAFRSRFRAPFFFRSTFSLAPACLSVTRRNHGTRLSNLSGARFHGGAPTKRMLLSIPAA